MYFLEQNIRFFNLIQKSRGAKLDKHLIQA